MNTWFIGVGILMLVVVMGGKYAGLPAPNTSPTPEGKRAVIEFRSDDGGDATANKYVRTYCRNLATLAKVTADRVRKTTDGSFDVAKDWAAASETARKEASKGVDARVSSLIQAGASREDCAKFIEDAAAEFERLGR